MKRKSGFLTWLVLISSFVLSACMGLIPLEEEPLTGEFGPKASPQEQQTKTFEALWKNFQDNYIYFETANVDWEALHDRYLERVNAGLTSEEFATLIKELESELPAGSLLHESRSERIERETVDTSSYEGIGAFVGFSEEPEPHIILLDVIEGSPAEQAGLKAHDSIFEIDGSPILLEEGIAAVDRVRGPAGSTVTLKIQSPNTPQRSIEVKRGKLTSTGRLEDDIVGTDYGYLLFPPVGYDTLPEDVAQGLQAFTTNRKLEGLILDLRIAGSARGWPLDTLYSMFHNGEVGEFYNRNADDVLQVAAQEVSNSQTVPLVILVGHNTTGFPEILAAGLQTHQRAIVIGETTPGAVETTTAFYLPDGSQAFIQSTSFRLLPGGDELGNTGVIPDIPVKAGWDEILPDQDPVLDRAIEYLDEQK